jgi:outer membrane protein assembly factor BamB
MADSPIEQPPHGKPLRVWPGAIAVCVQWPAWFVLPALYPEAGPCGFAIGLFAGFAVTLWWLLFSRASWFERFGVLAIMIVAIIATRRVVHESIAGAGMGWLLYIYAVPALSLALVAGAAAGRRLASGPRLAITLGAVLLACIAFTLLRTGGITGEGSSDLHWRWTRTHEQRLLAVTPNEPSHTPPIPAEWNSPPEWPGFRGPLRNAILHNLRIETDWSKSPPVEIWRRPIGPGWSSFAVQAGRVFTQEQRGEEETVSCYSLATGDLVWRHSDAVRFWESNAGAGPRATPALANGRVYTLGATGIVNSLDAATGTSIWSRNAADDTIKKVPHWGFAGSPIVFNDLVIVALSGQLAAYDIANGNRRWIGPVIPGGGYSSPHLVTIGDTDQILLQKGGGAISVAPGSGTLLWQHSWETGAGIVQPALVAAQDLLLVGADAMGGIGIRRVALARGSGDWTVEVRWTSRGLKPYFNDFVVHRNHAFGFDNSILACINLETGARTWKGGRYGHGQLLLLADQDLLLVLSEEGELALIPATPERFIERARFKAIEGKTWNHPVLVGNVLLVRNGEEMAAYRLARSTQ